MARTPPARTAGQRPLIAVVAAVVLAVGGLAVAGADPAPDGAGDAAAPRPLPSPEAGRTAEVVGPPRGADISSYVEDRTTELLQAPDGVDTAVVSFTETLRIEDALALVQGKGEVRAVLLRLPLEGNRPETMRVGAQEDPVAVVRQFLDGAAQPLRAEIDAQRQLLESGTIDDDAFEQDAERRIDEIQQVLDELDGDAAVVHALVLRASLDELQDLAGATAIRLVDPGPPGTDIGLSSFHGLLPSDDETVSFGPTP